MTSLGGSLRGPREAIEDKISSMKQVGSNASSIGLRVQYIQSPSNGRQPKCGPECPTVVFVRLWDLEPSHCSGLPNSLDYTGESQIFFC
jgi:hypothetical protein